MHMSLTLWATGPVDTIIGVIKNTGAPVEVKCTYTPNVCFLFSVGKQID